MRKSKPNPFILILMFIFLIAVGTYFYHRIEGWVFLDSLYFVFMTVTTVGYGDFVPITNLGKAFTILFSFTGIVFAFYFITVLGKKAFSEHVSKKVSQIKESADKDGERKA